MKRLLLLFACLFSVCFAQNHIALPHGMVFGKKPDTVDIMPATKVEAFMGNKARISVTISGKLIKVTKPTGGWFELDAGQGRIIAAHFAAFNVVLPVELKGRGVIIEGVAQKQFIADDLQHLAGDTVKGKKQHYDKTNPMRRVTFEVKGLMVNK